MKRVNIPNPTFRPKENRWMGQVRIGDIRRAVYGKTVGEYIDKARTLAGIEPTLRPRSIGEFWARKFEPWILARGLDPDTLARYASLWDTHLGQRFSGYLFSELTHDVAATIRLCGNAPASQKLAQSLLGQVIKLAESYPEYNCGPHVYPILKSIRIQKAPRVLPIDVLDKCNIILERLQQANHFAAGPWWAMRTFGLRKGEVCALKRTDIDLDACTLTIAGQRTHKRAKAKLKRRAAGQTATIGAPLEMLERLISFWNGESLFLFTDDDGKPISYNHFDRYIADFQTDPPTRVHDTRYACVAWLIESGANNREIMDITRHSDESMINYYRDISVSRSHATLRRAKTYTDNKSG